jgi:hypothetical protein
LRFRSPTEVHRSTPAPSRGPEGPPRRTMLPSLDSLALRHMTGRRTRFPRGFRPRCVPRPGFRPPSRLSPSSLPSAFRRRSVPRLHPSRPSPRRDRDPFRGPLPSWRSPRRFASPHVGRADTVASRASIPRRARSALPDPEGPGAPMPSWASSLQSTLPFRLSPPLWIAGDPLARIGRIRRPGPPASQGLEARKDRLAPLGATGSRGFSHLSTVATSRRPARGAGSWFRLTDRARCKRREPI